MLNFVAVSMVTVQCVHVGCQRDGWQDGGGASYQAGATGLHAAGATVIIYPFLSVFKTSTLCIYFT